MRIALLADLHANREATEAFFRENGFFGLAPEQVFFFTQGTMPACGYDGKLLLATKSSLSLSPDGHGGTLLALRKSGALDRMAHHVAAHGRPVAEVQRALPALGQPGARGGDDDGFFHGGPHAAARLRAAKSFAA